MSEVKPVLYLGTKLVPYEERTFRIADLRDAMGYTHDHKQFYSEEQVQKLLAENERLRAEVAEWKESYQQAADAGLAHATRAERLAEALRYAVEQVPELATVPGIAAALDQEGGK